MTSKISQIKDQCPSGEISAYIDGELSLADELNLEEHLSVCSICVAELNGQKTFLSALSSSLEQEKEFELPKNFTKTIVATAESTVTGLRRPRERFSAVLICTALFLFILPALGSDSESLPAVFGIALEKVAAVGAFVWRLMFSVSLGAAVIARSVASQIFFSSYISFLLFSGLFGFSLFACSRMILRGRKSS
ncbi:MAG: zf-HC2 domain-containing protein [Pyrinomonadaceae bacterium]